MSTPTLILGNNKWAIEEDNILGYAVEDRNGSYLPREISFTRGSDATYTDSTGVIRQACWNLLTYSEQFDNAIWGKSNITLTANSTTAPDGNIVADTIASTSSNAFVYQTFSATAATTYTFSVWVKAVSVNTSLELNLYTGGGASSVGAIIFTATDTWQRVSVTGTYSSASATAWATIGGNASFSTGESIYVWGAQLVQGSDALGYLRTTDRLNMPRVDSSTGTKAFLLEPQRTNLITQSQNFADVSWSKLGLGAGSAPVVTANAGTSPEGMNNATRVQFNCGGTTSSDRSILQKASVPITNTTNYAGIIYVKAYSSSEVGKQLRFISEGAVNQIIITLTDSWQKVTTTGVSNTTSSNFIIETRGTFTTNTTADILVWGAQLEAGAYPTTYIPTQATTVTRIADSFSRSNIYTNGYIGQTGGTWLVELRNNISYTRSTFGSGLYIDNNVNGATNGLSFLCPLPNGRITIWKVSSGSFTTLYTTTTNTCKIAIKWNGTTCDVFENGTKVVNSSSFTLTNMDFFGGLANDVPKYIQQMKLYSEPLSDAECIEITTL